MHVPQLLEKGVSGEARSKACHFSFILEIFEGKTEERFGAGEKVSAVEGMWARFKFSQMCGMNTHVHCTVMA